MTADLLDERGIAPGGDEGRAVFSPARDRRYLLVRRWGPGQLMTWAMLNPSKAGATRNDPTIARVRNRARLAGFPGIAVVNLFSLISPDPADLWRSPDPIGPGNDQFIMEAAGRAAVVVAAWGAHGAFRGRAAEVAAMLDGLSVPVRCLGLTSSGHPRHPGRLAYTVALVPFRYPVAP